MPRLSTKDDVCRGHDACPPRALATHSPDVTAENIFIVRENDVLQNHGCPQHVPHGATVTSGYSTVTANGRPVGYVGAKVDCASGIIATGRRTVTVGKP